MVGLGRRGSPTSSAGSPPRAMPPRAALFGMRGQLDLAAAASRSSRTADGLERIRARLLAPDLTLDQAARAMEEAAAVMLAELERWRVAYRHRELAIPA